MNNLISGAQRFKVNSVFLILCLSISLFCINKLTATTYYIAPTGNDSDYGISEDTAWQTIQKGVSSAVAGDTVYIKAGNYGNENIILPRSGTASSKITFEGYKDTPGDSPDIANIFGSDIFSAYFSRGTGTIVKDGSMNGSDGTIYGASWVNGIADSALDFDGTNDYVDFGNPSVLNMTESSSISAWIKPEVNGSYNMIAGKRLWGYSLFTSLGKLRAYITGSTSAASSASNESITTGKWQHVAMTFDVNGDKKIHLFINGQEVTYSTQTAMVGSPTTTNYDFSVGSDYNGTSSWFNGVIDEVKVYDRALDPQEIYNIYNMIYYMPLLDGGNRATAGTAINFNGQNHIVLKNINIQNYNKAVYAYSIESSIIENIVAVNLGDTEASYDGYGITVGSYGNYNIIKNCIIINSSAQGIAVSGDSNNVENCKVYCNDERSIDAAMDYYIIVNGNHNTVESCYVERVGNLPHGGHGIQFKGDAEYNIVKNSISVNQASCFGVRHRGVKYNTFENCTAIGGTIGDTSTSGLIVRDGASYNTFKKCHTKNNTYATAFYDTSEDGGAQSAGSYNKFENCIFEDTTSICIYFSDPGAAYPSPAFNNEYINCIFDGAYYLFGSNRENYDNKMANCILYNIPRVVSTGDTEYLDFEVSSSVVYNGISLATLFAGTVIDGGDNFSANPLFINAANGDYRLESGSPCIDAGSTVAISEDYDSSVRPYGLGYDIGVYEYVDKRPIVLFKLNENTGATASDKMGNISAGSISGAGWISGIEGSALDFDGSNDYVDFGNPTELNMTGSCSISAWIKPEVNGSYNMIAGKRLWGYSLFTSLGKLRAYIAGSSTSASSISNESITTGEWQHVAMTFDVNGDKKIHLYINGEEVTYSSQTAMTGTPVTTNHNFSVGSDYNGTSSWFNGMIDEVKVFIRPLTGQDVFADYCGNIFSTNLSEASGSNVNNAGTDANNGTVNGANWVNGIADSALDFDGTDDYVDFGNPAIFEIDGSSTISAWIKPDQTDGYRTIISKYYWGWSLSVCGGRLRAYIAGDTTSANSISNESISTGQWQHVAMAFDVNGDKKIHLYINGQEATYSTQTAMVGSPVTVPNDTVSIGSSEGYNKWFDGLIDEVNVYNRPLSSSEINAIYQTY